jgi:integrase
MRQKTSASGVLPASDVLPARNENVIRLPVRRDAPRRHATITKASLRRFVCPEGKDEAFYWDDQVRGLGLRAYKSGKRVWLLQYRDAFGKTRRIELGDVGALDPERAREAARAHLAQKAIGNDPAARRKADRRAIRLAEIAASYLAHQAKRAKTSTLDQIRRNLNKYAASIHGEPVAAIDRAALHRLHNRVTRAAGPVQANRTLASLSAMFAWAMRAGLAKENPAALVPRNPETEKDRVLTNDELRAIWEATEGGGDFDRIVRVLLLTGCRKSEIAGARWSEIIDTLLTIPEARTKTAIVHEVPLSGLAVKQLPEPREGRDHLFGESEEAGFSGWSRSKERLDKRVARLRRAQAGDPDNDEQLKAYAIPAWGLHDLRRTLSTRLNEAGVDPHVVEAILGHAGAKSGIAGVYNKATYRPQKTEALAKWAAMVASIVGGAP